MSNKEEKSLKKLYDNNYELISNLKLKDSIKEQLINLNNSLYNIAISSIKEPISIFIENISQRVIDIIIENIIKILEDYEISNIRPKFINDSYLNVCPNDLIVIDNYNLYDELAKVDRLKNEVISNKAHLIMGKEDPYSKDFFREKDLNNRIVFYLTGSNYAKEEILSELKEELKRNDIKYLIADSEWFTIIEKSLKEKKCYESNCADYLFKKALNETITKNNKEITKSCYFLFEEPEEEPIRLEDLVGLNNVKKEINSLKNYLAMQKRIGKVLKTNYLNMLFLGNPGTGKTTIGRIYASILYNLGIIKENKLIEIIPTDLMANYVGQTKDKTRKILDRAKGGVLFIDEAYLMTKVTYGDGFASYMSEAIVELMKYMEDPQNIVIFAGYPLETKKIYDTNPGMKSRICKEIIFDDYTETELITILKNNLKKLGFKMTKKAESSLKKIINTEKAKKNFGNARYCATLMQQILINYANNNLDNDTFLITEKDIKIEESLSFQIGFTEV